MAKYEYHTNHLAPIFLEENEERKTRQQLKSKDYINNSSSDGS